MATLTLRIPKGSPLTNAELDANFAELDNTKIQLGGDIGGSTSSPVITSIRGRSISTAAPTTGQALVYTGTQWSPQDVSASGGAVSSTVTSLVTSIVTSTVTGTISSSTTTYPTFSAYPSSSVTQSIPAGLTQTKVLFQNEEWDNNNNFASSRFTPTVAGYYQLNAVVRMNGPMGTSETMIVLWKNGSEYHRGWNNQNSTDPGVSWHSMQVSALAYANGTTDYFEIAVQHGFGTSRDVTVAHSGIGGNITWFNGIFVPTQVITAVTGNAVVSGAVSSTVTTSAVAGGGGVITVLNDISNQFNNVRRIFTLKSGPTAIVEGVNYRDNRDFSVVIGGRYYYAAVPQTTTLGPWIVDYTAERKFTFKVSGSRIFFSHAIANNQGAEIRINNISSSRQKRRRYPFTANSIVLGE
jgi:hypothetical protein